MSCNLKNSQTLNIYSRKENNIPVTGKEQKQRNIGRNEHSKSSAQ